MAAQRLTMYQRESIRDKAVEDAFDPRRDALRVEEVDCMQACLERFMKPAEMAAWDAVPRKWRREDCYVNVNCAGAQHQLSCVYADRKVYVPSVWNNTYVVSFAADDPLGQRVSKYISDKETYETERKSARLKVMGLLKACRNTNHLRAAWPEGEEYYKFLAVSPPPSLPAIKAPEVNAALGLPKDPK